jgi:hypothetical protein
MDLGLSNGCLLNIFILEAVGGNLLSAMHNHTTVSLYVHLFFLQCFSVHLHIT